MHDRVIVLVEDNANDEELTLRARATDLAGRAQPLQPEWNRHGYGNNAIHGVTIRVA